MTDSCLMDDGVGGCLFARRQLQQFKAAGRFTIGFNLGGDTCIMQFFQSVLCGAGFGIQSQRERVLPRATTNRTDILNALRVQLADFVVGCLTIGQWRVINPEWAFGVMRADGQQTGT